jgi:death-on-curing protein
MNGITWVRLDVIRAIHHEQLAEHGGASGVRALDMLESAIARPENLIAYGEPDLAELAAAYAYGIARNHPFVDGNKRTAFVVMELFLNLNNVELDARDEECVMIMLQVAEGSITEERLVVWIRERIEA